MKESFLNERVTLHPGDCLDVLARLEECSIDAVVCDPPYHLQSIVKRFAKTGRTDKTRTKSGPHQRTANGFMNKVWDGGDIAFRIDTWERVYHVLKPGAYIVAFSSARTFGRMSVAIEDAGFITHPFVAWIFGQGFPKAHSVSKHIDRMAGAEREVVRTAKYRDIRNGHGRGLGDGINAAERDGPEYLEYEFTAPATDAAREWDGWYYGAQSLKPAIEPIYLGQKPFEKGLNGTQNVLKWGTGALNIGATRIGTEGGTRGCDAGPSNGILGDGLNGSFGKPVPGLGRWPANVIHDGSEEVVGAFPDAGGGYGKRGVSPNWGPASNGGGTMETVGYGDSGSAARFFYTAKADADDRLGSSHPTVKPLDLMQYLVRLVTPPGGLVLDPFAGTGTTGEAAFREGMRAILIEREEEYQNDIRRRMKLVLGGPEERARESIKAKLQGKPIDNGPLFAEAAE